MGDKTLKKQQESELKVLQKVEACLNLDNPKSFFLFAGAGSGKTRTLVDSLNIFKGKYEERLLRKGQKVAVITYTNAACDEIKSRVYYHPLFHISTIHSFIWELIKDFPSDIKRWLKEDLTKKISELDEQQGKAKSKGKTYLKRERELKRKKKRLDSLSHIIIFIYNPNGENKGMDSLNHSEVLQIGAYFLEKKPLMQTILIQKYPVLLIDESQDTNKNLMDAFFEVEKNKKGSFSLGLFGDTMQRIYSDGKEKIEQNLPEWWEKPIKQVNYRCPNRIVTLINMIRSVIDDQEQEPVDKVEKEEGVVRLFVFNTNMDKDSAERIVEEKMAEITKDASWAGDQSDYKALILEHHMAAKRLGFLDIFESLYSVDSFKTGFLSGTLPEMNFFTQIVLPISLANSDGDKFTIANIMRENSPLLSKTALANTTSETQLSLMRQAQKNLNQLLPLLIDDKASTLLDILNMVEKTKLFLIPEGLQSFVSEVTNNELGKESDEEIVDEKLDALEKILRVSLNQVKAYNLYLENKSKFITHQGVKGLEFPRVMVVIDDSEAKGFMFSYDKLFGVKEKSVTDIKNEQEEKDTIFDRTRRLFYVICSRAKKSLAIVAYTENPEAVRENSIKNGWFTEEEVILSTENR